MCEEKEKSTKAWWKIEEIKIESTSAVYMKGLRPDRRGLSWNTVPRSCLLLLLSHCTKVRESMPLLSTSETSGSIEYSTGAWISFPIIVAGLFRAKI